MYWFRIYFFGGISISKICPQILKVPLHQSLLMAETISGRRITVPFLLRWKNADDKIEMLSFISQLFQTHREQKPLTYLNNLGWDR